MVWEVLVRCINYTYFPMVMRALTGFMAEPFPEEKDADPLDANPYTMFGLFQHAAETTKAACATR